MLEQKLIEGPEEVEPTAIRDRKIVPKLWGFEEWVANNDKYCAKRLYVLPGYKCSLHFHPLKDETFLCLEGLAAVEIGEGENKKTFPLRSWAGDAIRVTPGTPHRFWALDGPVTLLEVSTHHDDSDVVRIEPSQIMGDPVA